MRALAALALLALAGAAFAAQDAAPLTKNSVRAMAPEALTRRLFGELSRVMLPIAEPARTRPRPRPTRPLRSLSFLTVPRGSNDAGICESEVVTVGFEPAGPENGADTPVRPRAIGTSTQFFVRDAARMRQGGPVEAGEARALDAACAAADPRRARLISARGSSQVFVAVELVRELVEAARAGRATAPLDCDGFARPGESAELTEAACLREVAGIGPEQVSSVEECGSPNPDYAACRRVVVANAFQIDFAFADGNRRLARIRIDPMIVFADELID